MNSRNIIIHCCPGNLFLRLNVIPCYKTKKLLGFQHATIRIPSVGIKIREQNSDASKQYGGQREEGSTYVSIWVTSPQE